MYLLGGNPYKTFIFLAALLLIAFDLYSSGSLTFYMQLLLVLTFVGGAIDFASVTRWFWETAQPRKVATGKLVPCKTFDFRTIFENEPAQALTYGRNWGSNKANHYSTRVGGDPDFVKKNFGGAKVLTSNWDCIKYASESVEIKDGFYLEFGVCTGGSINFISTLNSEKDIYGFDSFEGLPEYWNAVYPKGAFSLQN